MLKTTDLDSPTTLDHTSLRRIAGGFERKGAGLPRDSSRNKPVILVDGDGKLVDVWPEPADGNEPTGELAADLANLGSGYGSGAIFMPGLNSGG